MKVGYNLSKTQHMENKKKYLINHFLKILEHDYDDERG